MRHRYENLLYTCDECNALKGRDWHLGIPLVTGRGYLDPCVHDYDVHFKVWNDGLVEGLTKVADYMIEHLWLNRKFLVGLRENRYKDHNQLTEYDDLIAKAKRTLAIVADASVQSELRKTISDLQAAKSAVQLRIQECLICQSEGFWRKKIQARKVPLKIKQTRRETPMLLRKSKN